jgi:hypothetical protein
MLPNYDMLKEVEKKLGHRLRLDDLCKATFDNDVKTDTYEQYRNYHKEGKWLELIDYCMNDVRFNSSTFYQDLGWSRTLLLRFTQEKIGYPG